ncbi:MAG TPA: ATP-dependent helicase, partial [Opitutaceae bacterium]
MQTHGPKRVYTPHSLEYWFDMLADDWSETFSASQLDEGRRIYRNGEVRELELTERDAIIHRRIEKKDEYAVIEWNAGALSVRSSTTDREIAHALAVAGLHEIEELVADEISPLPAEATTHADSNGGSHGGSGEGNGNGKAAVAGPAAPVSRLNGPSRPLLLVFKIRSSGLAFQAYWVASDRKTRHAALGPDAHASSNGNGHVSSGERAKLIGLAAYARKAHFQYNQDTGAYLMESLVEIPNFLKVTLPLWKRVFSIELDDKAANLLKGTRSVEIEAVAERAAGDAGLNLRWIFRAGERMLTDSEVSALLKRGGQPVILPNL